MQRITLADGKTIDLKLPAGVETGTQMRLAGKGQPGPGGPGDGIVTLTVKDHPFFERQRATIPHDPPITLSDAATAAHVHVPPVAPPSMLSLPPDSSPGQVLPSRPTGLRHKTARRARPRTAT